MKSDLLFSFRHYGQSGCNKVSLTGNIVPSPVKYGRGAEQAPQQPRSMGAQVAAHSMRRMGRAHTAERLLRETQTET